MPERRHRRPHQERNRCLNSSKNVGSPPVPEPFPSCNLSQYFHIKHQQCARRTCSLYKILTHRSDWIRSGRHSTVEWKEIVRFIIRITPIWSRIFYSSDITSWGAWSVVPDKSHGRRPGSVIWKRWEQLNKIRSQFRQGTCSCTHIMKSCRWNFRFLLKTKMKTQHEKRIN